MSKPIKICFACGDKINLNEPCMYGNKGDKYWCGSCHDGEKVIECKKCKEIVKKQEVKNNCCSKCFVSTPKFSDDMIYRPGSFSPRGCEFCDIPWAIERTEKDLKELEEWEVKRKVRLEKGLAILRDEQKKGGVCGLDEGEFHNYSETSGNAMNPVLCCLECGKTISKSNQYGDKWEDKNHSCNKDNNDNREREREREQNWGITNSDCWIRGYN